MGAGGAAALTPTPHRAGRLCLIAPRHRAACGRAGVCNPLFLDSGSEVAGEGAAAGRGHRLHTHHLAHEFHAPTHTPYAQTPAASLTRPTWRPTAGPAPGRHRQ